RDGVPRRAGPAPDSRRARDAVPVPVVASGPRVGAAGIARDRGRGAARPEALPGPRAEVPARAGRSPGMKLRVLPDSFSICPLAPSEPVPGWAEGAAFCSITRTGSELSLVVPSGRVPPGTRAESGWRALELEGPIPFAATGVLESLLSPLARAGVP